MLSDYRYLDGLCDHAPKILDAFLCYYCILCTQQGSFKFDCELFLIRDGACQLRMRFKVLTEAFVSRVLLSNIQGGDDLTATGVEFTHGGKGYTVKAKNEVILSAGYRIRVLGAICVLLTWVLLQYY